MLIRFEVVPSSLSSSPARAFATEDAARTWADRAADRFSTRYDVWLIEHHRGHKLASFIPQDRRASDE